MKPIHIPDPLHLDLRALALTRLSLGALMLADLGLRARDLGAHYSEAGIIPTTAVDVPLYAIHAWPVEQAGWVAGCFAAHAVVTLLWTLGWRTRWTGLACLVFMIGLHARAPWVLHRGDMVARLMLFWSTFLPMGARWSLDALLGRGAPDGHERVEGLAAWAWTLQLAQVYLWSVGYKLHPAWTHDATAVHEALALDPYTTDLGRWIGSYPPLTRALTWGTLALEGLGPLLLFVRSARVRAACVLAFVGFHLGLMATMRLGLFMPIMVCVWVSMLPSTVFGREDGSFATGALSKRWTRWLLLGLILYTPLYNADTLRRFRITHHAPAPETAFVPEPVRALTGAIGLDQRWSMFAPHPARQDTWVRIVDASSGEDVFSGLPDADARPHDMTTAGPLRWRQLTSTITGQWDFDAAERLARWQCTQAPEATELTVVVTLEVTAPPGEPSELEWIEMARVPCSGVVAHEN
jgi:hypothetical protein